MHIRISGDSACDSQMKKSESGSVRALQAIPPARMETSHEQCVTFNVRPSYTLFLRPNAQGFGPGFEKSCCHDSVFHYFAPEARDWVLEYGV